MVGKPTQMPGIQALIPKSKPLTVIDDQGAVAKGATLRAQQKLLIESGKISQKAMKIQDVCNLSVSLRDRNGKAMRFIEKGG